MKQAIRIGGGLVLGIVLTLALVTQVSAHAEYDHSVPADGATVTTAPTQVDAFFDADIQAQAGSYELNVLNASSQDVDNNDTVLDAADATHLTVTLQADLPNGTYTVEWSTVAAEDGDSADGTFSFTIDAQVAPTATTPAASETPQATTEATALPSSGGATPTAGGDGSQTWLAIVAASAGVVLAVLGFAGVARRRA
jgi:methionine-rich copper-binding protein CopC